MCHFLDEEILNVLVWKREYCFANYAHGMQDSLHNWFSSYLHRHHQFVKINDTKSSNRKVICGAPQGSNLGPLSLELL